MNGDGCQRDIAGFCVFATLGNPRCFRGRGESPCLETDPAEARRHTVDFLLRRERAVRPKPAWRWAR